MLPSGPPVCTRTGMLRVLHAQSETDSALSPSAISAHLNIGWHQAATELFRVNMDETHKCQL